MATNSLPLNPTLTFKHISVHIIHVLARIVAKEAVKAQLKADGVRFQYVPPSEINERATTICTTIQRSGRKRWQEHIGSMTQRVSVRRSGSSAENSWPDWCASRSVT